MTKQTGLTFPIARRAVRPLALAVVLAGGLLLATVGARSVAAAEGTGSGGTVLFVCEHGSAKSLLAAMLFNREAARRHLDVRAIARGTTPDRAAQPATQEGLRGDGIDVAAFVPQRVSVADVDSALAVVAFGVDLAPFNPKHRPVAQWNDTPPVSADYHQARDAILRSIDSLVRQLQSAGPT